MIIAYKALANLYLDDVLDFAKDICAGIKLVSDPTGVVLTKPLPYGKL